MIDNSVLGKDWMSKNYSEEKLNFLKDNFNLSEILSKLLAIRNIKLEDVKVFLNPKIKKAIDWQPTTELAVGLGKTLETL